MRTHTQQRQNVSIKKKTIKQTFPTLLLNDSLYLLASRRNDQSRVAPDPLDAALSPRCVAAAASVVFSDSFLRVNFSWNLTRLLTLAFDRDETQAT